MDVTIRLLHADDAPLLQRAEPDVFDDPVIPERVAEFLQDPRHHLAAALDGDRVVGIASAVHYVHPDKDPELWINEVGVSPDYRQRGIATRLLEALFDLARSLGCAEAWVLTDATNDPAMRLYRAAGGAASEQVMFSFRLNG